MQKENIELRSPKVQNVIGKMPRRLVLSAILIYVIVFLLVLLVIYFLDLESANILSRLLKQIV
ncbi:hypothetical protein D8S85_05030 [Butyricimonas faecalis]|uniref:Uncharacterized protein n=1 Tax=Butyricimonas faecalis TaxID=2093856 RepID=A0A3Q9ISH2_9BACT|nr:hypothetical protein D8S85_05030 [Butyricimonas faecalis]